MSLPVLRVEGSSNAEVNGDYGIDSGCAEYDGVPQFKHLRGPGLGFFTPGLAVIGSRRLYREGRWWRFRGFPSPSGGVEDYTAYSEWTPVTADTLKLPPRDGWQPWGEVEACSPITVTLLLSDTELNAHIKAQKQTHRNRIDSLLAATYPHGAPENAVIRVEGSGYLQHGSCTDGYYGIDPECAEYNGRPLYKKVKLNGSFFAPGRRQPNSQCLGWAEEMSTYGCWLPARWQLGFFGGTGAVEEGAPHGLHAAHGLYAAPGRGWDSPYINTEDAPFPPAGGWEQDDGSGVSPFPMITYL